MTRKHNPKHWPDDAHDIMINRDLFESRIQKDPVTDCWNFTGPKHRQGYGFISALRKQDNRAIMVTAHRVSYRLYCGPIVLPNVNHTCHNTACVNPAHLYNGTQKDNVRDIYASGRNNPTRRFSTRPNRGNTFSDPATDVKKSQRQKNRVYKYSEEDIQFGRSSSLDAIQKRFNVERYQAVGLRHEFFRGYRWLPWPENNTLNLPK